MKYYGKYDDPKDLIPKEYADTKYAKPSSGIPKTDLASDVQASLNKADNAVQPEAGKGLFSGSYNDLTNKPTIPSALSQLSADATHRTVTDTEKSAWNAKGTYNKPSGGIPKTDLASDVQASLNKADGSVAKNQGDAHAGEFLIVGDDGNVTTQSLGVLTGGSY